jgi:hypothetical protein
LPLVGERSFHVGLRNPKLARDRGGPNTRLEGGAHGVQFAGGQRSCAVIGHGPPRSRPGLGPSARRGRHKSTPALGLGCDRGEQRIHLLVSKSRQRPSHVLRQQGPRRRDGVPRLDDGPWCRWSSRRPGHREGRGVCAPSGRHGADYAAGHSAAATVMVAQRLDAVLSGFRSACNGRRIVRLNAKIALPVPSSD